jgi:hypothetical protein
LVGRQEWADTFRLALGDLFVARLTVDQRHSGGCAQENVSAFPRQRDDLDDLRQRHPKRP